ncbi:hypothetical protein [Budvicia aquatica]|uniref:Uncharacterized protein n=1 Tax=Budvicia aquatica TaxID=82979 RepID=A0A484ZSC7_9GAMM|nr:hypothetical protein [Budvicia aquatica]VFS51412.1 Uncharacterised protein [Budvicia aquatica]
MAYTQLSAYGMDKYVPPEQLNQLIANKDQLPQLAQQAKEVAPKLNMTDASQRGLQSLGTTLSNSGDKIFAAFVQAIEKLNGPIETLSKTFSNAVADFLIGPNGQAVFDVLSDGLNKFSSWISSPKFQQDLKDFGTCVADVVTGLARFITFLSDPRKFAAELEKESSFTQPGDENKPKDGSVVGFAVAAGKTMIGIGTTIWDSTAGGGINELNRQSGALIGGNDPRGVDMAPQDEDRKLRMYGYSQYKQWAASVGRLSGISGDITRGKMGFNPGNLVDVGQKGAGIIGKDYGGQAIFDTLENGVIANLKQLKRNINGQNRNNLGFRYDTIDKLVESWDKTEGEAGIAGRASYKKMIGNALGLKPTDQLDTANADQMAILFKHMAKFETGMDLPANDLKRIYLQLDVKQQPGSDIQTQLRSADAGIPVGVRLGG